ncbi:cysteine proteinase [Wolfiporia cocos MD-104 SS10]|uniref:Ubiquitin carboxyl-terminal hydrolase n=1 Tax=Wolfiporia cocos (strain MD-104) TaxID=742152 RepID=A0A2H3JUE8_WOLCO|nr:cysteine proteinase [Wolfiporia cocos MD-104 SS10]
MADSSGTCPHAAMLAVEDEDMQRTLNVIATWNVQRATHYTRPAKRRKVCLIPPTCGTCEQVLTRPFVCIQCRYTGCWQDGHVKQHLDDNQHGFCIDVRSGSLFCSACDDFVYDNAFDRAMSTATLSAEEKNTAPQAAKSSREPFKPWAPNDREAALLKGAVSLPCYGLRGLLNLGQTCFMNAILQSFIANPLLRNHFLSDKHNHLSCKTKDCTCCEMDTLFEQVYSEDTVPYGPTSFLATTWRASSELSGYAQQDAHEFFISALDHIHATSRQSTKMACICIVHSTFSGTLRSEVECKRCGNMTTKPDPMLDISLDLQDKTGERIGQELTLESCLRKFTQPEKLGPNEYDCAKCGKASHESSKRMSIQKLPPVLSFQFKRFEHKNGDRTAAHKIEAPVRFPASINMAPYTTLVMEMQDQEAKGSGTLPGPGAMYEYDLFSVVCHDGQINNGHYTCFARSQDEWHRFDDDKVTPSTLGACLASKSQAYMCFYVKRHLDYMPYVTPSYKITREAEAVKEKEREREKEAARMKEVEDALLATV